MHLNDASLMGKEAGAGGAAAMAGPASNTEMATQTLKMRDAADWIVIMVNSQGNFYRKQMSNDPMLQTCKHRREAKCATMSGQKRGQALCAPQRGR
jgi:hypothetical protein